MQSAQTLDDDNEATGEATHTPTPPSNLRAIPAPHQTVHIEPAPGETALRWLVTLTAIGLWGLCFVTVVPALYAAFLGLFFFAGHLIFISYLRGSAVRLGPNQLPELHERVVELSAKLGLNTPPTAYVMEQGGALNALATRFFGSSFIVLYSDLLEACGDNHEARDFIIAHELGHLKARHLHWALLRLPGRLIPFLGQAYARACEFTADRYGMAGVEGNGRGLQGLVILAAGAKLAPRIDVAQVVAQRADLATPLMRIGTWLTSHPPIAARLDALDPALSQQRTRGWASGGAVGAMALLATLFIGVPAGMGGAVSVVKSAADAFDVALTNEDAAAAAVLLDGMEAGDQEATGGDTEQQPAREITAAKLAQAKQDVQTLAKVAHTYMQRNGGVPPPSHAALYAAWKSTRTDPEQAAPVDPYDGEPFGYKLFTDGTFAIFSAGHNQHPELLYVSGQN